MTEVLLFAALRDAAGERRTTSQARTVSELVTELRGRYGETFAERLEVATILVDGEPTDHDSHRPLTGTEEVALLPPFAGGASGIASDRHAHGDGPARGRAIRLRRGSG